MISLQKTNTIGVIGSGAMGSGIAQVAAAAGENVVLYDSSPTALQKAKAGLDATLKKLAEKGKMPAEEANAVLSRIRFASDLGEFSGCGLVIEAIIEDLQVKQKVFSELEAIVTGDCVLATNTSSLPVTAIASACAQPARVIGIHFFNPAPLLPLVEIIPSSFTDATLPARAKSLMEKWKKVPVIAKDTPGFIVNRVARPFYSEAIRIYEEGFVGQQGQGFATIDWAMKEFGGFKMGPFELMDLIGNDVNYTVTETVWKQFFFDPKYKPSLTQKRLFEARLFGKKTGRGYYDYSRPMPEPLKDITLGENICWRVLVMLINEAADALYYGVAAKEDIDLAMTKGVNYPKGLLKWADEKGIEFCLQTMDRLYAEYGEDRYRASVQLRKMVREGKRKFYE